MHAAASYGQLEVLEYLVSRGGDVNVTDGDGDTPLYVVENVETARFLVVHGAIVDRINNEGVSPIEYLNEDFAEVASYLQTTLTPETQTVQVASQPSQHLQNIASEHLTSALMSSVQDIIQRAEAEGRDPEEEIRQIVSQTVLEGVVTGFDLTTNGDDRRGPATDGVNRTPSKRPKTGGLE